MEKQTIVIERPETNAPSDTDDSKTLERDPTATKTADELSDVAAAASPAGEDDHGYVTGVKLTVVMISVTLVGFLIMLDTSIIATVRVISIFHAHPQVHKSTSPPRFSPLPFPSRRTQRLSVSNPPF